MFKVLDVMTRNVQTVPHSATVQEAAEKMKADGIGSLPVTRDSRLVGTLTDRDITTRVTAEGRDPRRTLVRDVMTSQVITVQPQQDLADAESLMRDYQIRRIPVVESDGRVVGYLTVATIAKRSGDEKAVGSLLKGICRPSRRESEPSVDRPRENPRA